MKLLILSLLFIAACSGGNGGSPPPAVCSPEIAVEVLEGNTVVTGPNQAVVAIICPVGSGDMVTFSGTIDYSEGASQPLGLRIPGYTRNSGYGTWATEFVLIETEFSSGGTYGFYARYDGDGVIRFKIVDTATTDISCAQSGAGGVTSKCPFRAAEGIAFQPAFTIFIPYGLTEQ